MSDASSAPKKHPWDPIVAWFTGVMQWVLSTKPARAFLRYQEHHGPMLADSVTYRTLFSIFAGVFLGFAIAGLWLAGNQDAMDALVATLGTAIPGLVGDGGLIDPDDLVQPLTLSLAGAFALVGLIGAAIGAIRSLRIALRTVSDESDDKTFFLWLTLRDLGLALGFGLALAAAAAVTFLSTTALNVVFDWLGLSTRSWMYQGGSQAISILVIFAIDTAVVAVMFRLLSGLKPNARSLWSGAIIGGVGLTVLQVLSSLFVGGAKSNPLLASFGSLIALLLWINFSAQVILIAFSYIVTGVEEQTDRVKARYGAQSIAERNVKRAERKVANAAAELESARAQAAKARPVATEASAGS
ncbi:YihY/virulence factor BrkB family protein [Rathayibacter sp. YIM 133350]|uniref:YihY/virulence factor BrkB family protein n=1 Tax=Rathayibacter sp. YIM 133350 TaxID=3131992 RepID=UPI00307EC77D